MSEFKSFLTALMRGTDLSAAEMEAGMDAIMDGEWTPVQVGAFLTALRIKGESVDEICAAARSMRHHAMSIDAGAPPIVDTCGTGGDGAGTFNISTAAAFIAAGAGVKIAKHGNRAASSRCGSVDVLAALGVTIDASPETVGRCVREVGIGFLFAPKLHGAMKYAIGPRRELGVRTVFNVLGPLTNPAGATAQVIGIFDETLVEPIARVLALLGTERAFVVHGEDGLDEISTAAWTKIAELKNGEVQLSRFDPRPWCGGDFADATTLAGGDADENAAIIQQILDGKTGPKADIARLNAAAAIQVAGKADNWSMATALAQEAIDSGAAKEKLAALIRESARS